ncbi:MAG: carotenoid 1,2-hydratase [Chloroflexi bacterium]|nr:carotenoid 1,2-hydratase [Chloroflexota bacterium]
MTIESSQGGIVNWRIITLLLLIGLVLIFGISLIEPFSGSALEARTQFEAPPLDTAGFARAIEPWDWQFPRDHGAHPAFQTEWWYYTGVLATDDGRRFGFQFTIFRRAISPLDARSDSEFRTSNIYMAHFTVSDIAAGRFYHDVRYSRGGAGLAGATSSEQATRYRVWLEDWQVSALTDDAARQHITAASDEFALDLILMQVKPPALQGYQGLSPKSEEVGNASYYYSLTRLVTGGTITVGAETFTVSGNTWMDHEFSTSALGDGAQGWDWFGLIIDDDTELMIGQIRQIDGSIEPAFGGLLVYPDGSTRALDSGDFSLSVTDTWRSPHTDADYPAGWDIQVLGDDGFRFSVAPLQADQELHSAGIQYWEGAVQVSGDVSGYGYAELTGYVDSMQNRF